MSRAALAGDRAPLGFVILGDPASPHTTRWVDGLRARGHDVVLIPSKEPGPRGPAKLARWLRRRWTVRRLLRSSDRVLMVQYIPAGIRATALLGIHPRIGVAWGSDIYLSAPRTIRLAVAAIQQRLFLRGCDAVIAASIDLGTATIAAGARPGRVTCMPFGVDLDRFRPGPEPAALRSQLGLDGRRVVLSNRAIAPIYHQTTVVEALAQLPADVVAVMSRHLARPAEVQAVTRRARELGVEDRVRIVDPIDDADMPDLYRLADVVVSVAASDGGPVTILEAMACGRPIVASDLPGIREWLWEIDPSCLVPVGDSRATAGAILAALARSPAEHAEIGERERAVVQLRADRNAAFGAAESIHRAVTDGRPTGPAYTADGQRPAEDNDGSRSRDPRPPTAA